ncbi:hypothetical protein GCM10011374_29660 [Kocuria dechangensis]|uniref:SLH domain-containing protein n=1 Tax=Kocuria dechangensis TaxID=1176249 RepID=A0A917H1V9_9MICC|nr:hypothetical protein GCM10011374_29660 [Kocuria dechangensis]
MGRHRNLFRTFSLTNSNGVGVARVGTANYMVTFNAGEGVDTVQVFHADTGALHYKASTPGKPAGNFTHDGRGNIYFSVDKALMVLSIPNRTLRQYGTVGSGILVAYEFHFDHRGRLWTGSYPAGRLVCLDPATGRELARTPVLGNGNDYARGVTISPDRRTVWAGTGTADPALFRIDVDNPASPTRINLPAHAVPSMVMRMQARGRKVFVWHDDPLGKEIISVYDVVSRTWSRYPTAIAGWSVTAPDAAGYVYANAKGSVVRMRADAAVLVPETVATGVETSTIHTALAGSTLYLVKEGPSLLQAGRFAPTGGALAAAPRVDYKVVPVPLTTQSVAIDKATNTVYAGGFKGDGLCATNLSTGEFSHSAASAGIAQIEGLTVAGGKLYVGSYGSAVVVEHDLAKGVKDAGAYRRVAKLGTSHLQSRIFAWAVSPSRVVFGTVPEYGYRGGALGTIDRATGAVAVYNKIIPELSVVGLAVNGETVYGTTSCRGGYGIADWPGDAVVFCADARTGRVAWKRTLKDCKELYGPVLLDGKLYVGTLDTVVELRLSDGVPLRTFVLGSRSARAAWQSAELVRIPGTRRLAHLAGGVTTVLEPATSRTATVLTGAHRHIDFDASGAMWVTTGNDVVKLRLDAVAAGPSYVAPKVSPFADVSTGQKYYREMAWSYEAGIATGWMSSTGARSYRPLRPINRDAMAAFLYRAAGSPEYVPPTVSPFRDVSTSQQFYKEMAWVHHQEISTGWDDGTYRPLRSINRDAMAAFLYRAAGSPEYVPPTVSPFRDVSTSQQFYKEMAWVYEVGISTGWLSITGTRTYRPLLPINRDAMAAFLYRAAARGR